MYELLSVIHIYFSPVKNQRNRSQNLHAGQKSKLLITNDPMLWFYNKLFTTFVVDIRFSVTAARWWRLKGNPVKIRNYPRSCEFQKERSTSFSHCRF
jgi:hypothetical protein